MKLTKLNKISKITKRLSRGGVVLPPFAADLTFDFNKRTDLTLVDSIAADNASVVGGYVGVFDGASYIDTGIPSNTISKIEYYGSIGNAGIQFIGAGAGASDDGLYFGYYVDGFIAGYCDSANTSDRVTYNSEIILHTLEINGNDLTYIANGETKTIARTTGSVTTNNFFIGARKRPTIDGYVTGQAAYCKITHAGGVSEWYFNGHSYNSIDGTEATWTGTETYARVTDYTPASTLEALDSGYYEDVSGNQIVNPQYEQTTETLFAGGSFHNLIDSYIEFPVSDIFDRSNTTIYAQSARDSAFYDSNNPFLFHISELNYDTWNSYLNAAYQDRNFTGINTNYGTQLNIFEILSYATQKTGQDLIDVLDYIKYNYVADGYEALRDSSGSILYDSEGKILTVPIS